MKIIKEEENSKIEYVLMNMHIQYIAYQKACSKINKEETMQTDQQQGCFNLDQRPSKKMLIHNPQHSLSLFLSVPIEIYSFLTGEMDSIKSYELCPSRIRSSGTHRSIHIKKNKIYAFYMFTFQLICCFLASEMLIVLFFLHCSLTCAQSPILSAF